MVPKAYGDRVVVKPREELDQASYSSMIILPGNAQTTDRGYGMNEADATAICEVVSLGRQTTSLQLGDVVLFDLHGISQIVFFDGEGYLMMPERTVRARVHNVGNEAAERVEPLFDYVLTVEDKAAFRRHVLGDILVPEDVFVDGYGDPDSITRFVLERAICTGPEGSPPDEEIHKDDLVFFNPAAACRFRRFSKHYRLTQREDVLGALEE